MGINQATIKCRLSVHIIPDRYKKKKIKKITRFVFAMREWRRRGQENGTHGAINLSLVDSSFARRKRERYNVIQQRRAANTKDASQMCRSEKM